MRLVREMRLGRALSFRRFVQSVVTIGGMLNPIPVAAGDMTLAINPREIVLKQKLLFLLLLVCLAVGLFLSVGVTDWGFALPRRGRKVLTMILVGAAISYSTVLFQTITNNKILTPSIIGFDSLFVLMQTAFVFFFGSLALMRMDENLLFLLNAGSMILFAGALYRWLFNREGVHLYFLVLVGVVFGILFGNISNFMQKLLDPNEFSILQDSLFASIANADQELLMISTILILATAAYSFRFAPYLDVLSLGRDVAINLGVDHTLVINRLMIVIAIFVSISTALVGPITFFGLLVANLAYQVMQTHRHSYLVPAAILMSIVALVGGQFMLERVFAFNTTINVVINFVGGLYFLYLILMEARR